MCDGLFMQVGQCFDDVSQEINSLLQVEIADLVEIVEESSSVHVLHGQIDVILVLEKAIEPNDVGMVKAKVKLYLAAKLVKHFVLNDLAFDNLLYGHNETSLMMTSQKYLPKLSLA